MTKATSLRRGSQEEGNTDYFTGCPIGGGFIWYGLPSKIPANCRICDNSSLAISQFAKLYENLGNSWGESGGNVNIPDLRGRFPRGVDGAANRDPDKAARTAANVGGATGNAVGSVQDHAVSQHNTQMYVRNIAIPGDGPNAFYTPAVFTPSNPPVIAGANVSTEDRPKNANVYFVIRVS